MRKSPYTNKQYIRNANFLKVLYNNNCPLCNTKQNIIEVHHNDNNPYNNNLINLIPICSKCHLFIHKKSLTIDNILVLHKKYLEAFINII